MTLALAAVGDGGGGMALAAERQATEYQIKAVYLYNFLLFTKWPEDGESDASKDNPGEQQDTIMIGILGDDTFGDSFAEVEGKVIKSHKQKLVIMRLGRYHKRLDLSPCDLLFICESEKDKLAEILSSVGGEPVLTVADSGGFLETGGMINFVQRGKKVRWEINQTPVKRARLQLSSQLLRNAVRVVEIPQRSASQKGGNHRLRRLHRLEEMR